MTSEQIKQTASKSLTLLPDLLFNILPGGRMVGREYTCGDLTGGLGQSCKVNTVTGKWSDFATGVKGGDTVSLLAAIDNCSQSVAARKLAESLGDSITSRLHEAGGVIEVKGKSHRIKS